ncbi:PAS domain S-box protein [Sulfurimonas sp. SAG-AH-194-I05]|nr:PAS domain-containing hybrid sensor histidine kinase/response regulator [Sulfurimonas sp. SAG-AH-194-I05]MDF1875652.1 PAS domain S-box protein [Sulfurimonas sp. SAG-AH-194-I05]
MNRLLSRQIKRALGKDFDINTLDENVQILLNNISTSYENADREKKLLENTLEVNSDELYKANKLIKNQNLQNIHFLEQYKYAIDNSLIVSRTDKQGIITYANENFCVISGYQKEELLGQPHNIINNPDVDKNIFKDMWNTLLDKKVWSGNYSNKNKDGSLYYVDATIFPILDREKNIVELVALRQNITERKELEQKNILATQRLKKIMDSQDSMIIILSKEEGIVEVNSNFYALTGYKNLETFKKDHACICELFIEKEEYLKLSHDAIHWTNPLFSNENTTHKALIKNSENEEVVFKVNATHIDLDTGTYILATFSDISQIEAMRNQAEKAEKIKSQFLANMSHELRTPLNAIIGFSQILNRNKELAPKPKSYVNKINDSGNKLLHLINLILDFSKIEAGEIELEYIDFNLYDLIQSAITQLELKAKEKNLNIFIDENNDIDYIFRGDSFRISQILINLIGNAVKFTEEGSIRIIVLQLENKKYRFEVKDTGIGLSKKQKDKLFKPFSQADSSTTRSHGGTGLGLSISKELIELMNGKIWIESEIGVGTSFIFEIDLQKVK